MDDDTPFYLRASGKQIIMADDIIQFKRDNPELGALVDQYEFPYRTLDQDLFTSFCHWIIGQQLSVKAAESIIRRFIILIDPLTPKNLLKVEDDKLRECGLSNAKTTYIKNIARFVIDNYLHPMVNSPDEFSSDELRDFFTQIKGIGPWTVNMYLIFVLGKPDVFAVGDLAVRKGIQLMYNLEKVPNERECRKNYSWGSCATVGSFLAWKILED